MLSWAQNMIYSKSLVLVDPGLLVAALDSYKPLEPRKGEPKQPNQACVPLEIIGKAWVPFPKL